MTRPTRRSRKFLARIAVGVVLAFGGAGGVFRRILATLRAIVDALVARRGLLFFFLLHFAGDLRLRLGQRRNRRACQTRADDEADHDSPHELTSSPTMGAARRPATSSSARSA